MIDHSPPVFLCGHRKSGTSLVLNLFDGHPDLAVYPIDLTLLYAYFPDFMAREAKPGARRDRLRRILFEELAQHFEKRSAGDVATVDRIAKRFFQDLPNEDLGDAGALLTRLFSAFQATCGPLPDRAVRLVAKETSTEIYAEEILGWFPSARFIHIIRDPRDVFAALAAGVESHYAKLGEDHNQTLTSLLFRCRLGLRMAAVNSRRFGPQRYRCVRFEDLVDRPEEAMRDLASFLDISFDARLLQPTVAGQPTSGNNYDGAALFSISDTNVGRWRERISDTDAQIIEFHLAQELREFEYKPEFSEVESAKAAAEFYKWQNYKYFYSDRFA